MKVNSNKCLFLFTIFAACATAVFSAVVIGEGAGNQYNRPIGVVSILVFSWCIFSLWLDMGSLFSLIFMFETSFYVLTLGQCFLYGLNIPLDSALDLYLQEPVQDVNKAYLYSICCLLAMHIGILSYKKKDKNKRADKGSKGRADYSYSMRMVGWIAFPIALMAYVYQALRLFAAYSDSGYAVAYRSISGTSIVTKILNLMANYFPYILFLLLASYRRNRLKKIMIIAVILMIAVFNFMLGNRSEPICYIMTVIWFWHRYADSKLEKRQTNSFFIICGIIVLLVVPVIGETRNTGELSFSRILSSLMGSNSAITQIKKTFISMGWSAFPTVKTMQLIPESYSYHCGESYLFALSSIFPNIFGGVHIAVRYAGLPQWLMNVLHMTFGPGFSMPAEAYYNFGWFGILVLPFLGMIIKRILDEQDKDESALRLFVMMSGFVILFSIPRREMLTAVRNLSYYVGLLCIAVHVCYSGFRGNTMKYNIYKEPNMQTGNK